MITLDVVPLEPRELGRLGDGLWLEHVVVEGEVAYVYDRLGLIAMGVASPSDPVWLGAFRHYDGINELAVSDGIVYLSDSGWGVRIVDMTDPVSPEYLGGHAMPGHGSRAIEVEGSTLYAVDLSTVEFIDVSDPASPEYLGEYDALGFDARDRRGDDAVFCDPLARPDAQDR
jgi:hypothetical protein